MKQKALTRCKLLLCVMMEGGVKEAPGSENTKSVWGDEEEKVSGDGRPGMLKRTFHHADENLGTAFLVEGCVRTKVWRRQEKRRLVWYGWNAGCVWSVARDETVTG